MAKKSVLCGECGSTVRIDEYKGVVGGANTILHNRQCSQHIDNILKARKEELLKQQGGPSGPSARICKPQPQGATMGPLTEADRRVVQLKKKLEGLKTIVVNSLEVIDWTVKLGLAIALWFFPVVQEGPVQAIGIAAYVFLLTLISKGITKAKAYDINIED